MLTLISASEIWERTKCNKKYSLSEFHLEDTQCAVCRTQHIGTEI